MNTYSTDLALPVMEALASDYTDEIYALDLEQVSLFVTIINRRDDSIKYDAAMEHLVDLKYPQE